MNKLRVLIVDDSIDVGRVLKQSLELVSKDLIVSLVPSAEEAMLDSSVSKTDLLVSDIRLPGISGFELTTRLKRRSPDLKVILITGMPSPELKQKAIDAGAAFFFRKPISTDQFIEAVSQCLNLKIEEKEETAVQVVPVVGTDGLGEFLSDLRKDLDAFSVILLDTRGQIVMRAGEPPLAGFEDLMVPAIINLEASAQKLTRLMGHFTASGVSAYHGTGYDLVLAPMQDYSLVLFTKPGKSDARLMLAVGEAFAAKSELLKKLQSNETLVSESPAEIPEFFSQPIAAPITEEVKEEPEEPVDLSQLEEVFNKKTNSVKREDADTFWEKAATKKRSTGQLNPDTITYNQAQQLGLAPDSEDSEKNQ